MNLSPLTQHLSAAAFAAIAVCGIIGNAVSLVVIRRIKQRRNAHMVFISALCAADLLFCCTSVPVEMLRFASGKWLLGKGAVCNILGFMKFFNMGVSLLMISLIAVNRFVMVVYIRSYDIVYKNKYVYAQIAGVCGISLSLLLPTLIGVWGEFGFKEDTQNCTILETDSSSPMAFLFSLAFIVPSIAIIACYSAIAVHVSRSTKRVQQHNSMDHSLEPKKPSTSWKPSSSDYSVIRIGATVFSVFILLCLPNTILIASDLASSVPGGVEMAAFVLMYATSCVNPIIYVIMDRRYRSVCRSLFGCQTPAVSARNGSLNCQNNADHSSVDCEPVTLESVQVDYIPITKPSHG